MVLKTPYGATTRSPLRQPSCRLNISYGAWDLFYLPVAHLEAACRRVHGGNVLAIADVLHRKLGRGIPECMRVSGSGIAKGYCQRVLPRLSIQDHTKCFCNMAMPRHARQLSNTIRPTPSNTMRPTIFVKIKQMLLAQNKMDVLCSVQEGAEIWEHASRVIRIILTHLWCVVSFADLLLQY